ncbi:Uncharacterised protein [Shigella sonnei]|nr:Uncharacterised protein [Shigella sonnei]
MRKGPCPRLTHRQHSRRAVVAHTGQDHPNRITPRLFGDRMEQHIYRRPMTVNRRAVVNFDLIICATTRQFHMPIARRNIGMPRQDTFSVFGFFNPDLAKLIKSVGKRAGETGRHMLGN